MSRFFVYHIIPYILQVVDICALALDVWQRQHYLAETSWKERELADIRERSIVSNA